MDEEQFRLQVVGDLATIKGDLKTALDAGASNAQAIERLADRVRKLEDWRTKALAMAAVLAAVYGPLTFLLMRYAAKALGV